MQWASQQRESRKEDWANGAFVASFGPEHFIRDAGAQGFCSAMSFLLEIEARDLELSND